ncbi:hypothetical protein [Herbiconiux daphne]|uniref:Uncharacterized protein n=1 Tax=Herbiconiux daphne TaxID=2970914 RepID=A0ABT2H0M8_9MICO|nr:hypothetical protein [Herbiconiux daphne]MCS5733485.1 hypothetical protein [Herbiconiux daphne]
MIQPKRESEATDEIVVEWRRGSWYVRGGERSLATGMRSLAEVRANLWTGDSAGRDSAGGAPSPELRLLLPPSVQRYVDEARALGAGHLPKAAEMCRRAAVRLLRSKRMSDDDIASCLGVPVSAVTRCLPDVLR